MLCSSAPYQCSTLVILLFLVLRGLLGLLDSFLVLRAFLVLLVLFGLLVFLVLFGIWWRCRRWRGW